MALTPDDFAARTGVSRETLSRLSQYADLLVRWNARINLVGASTLSDMWRRHFLDSAQLVPYIPRNAGIVVDLGSGAGFPGLVIAAMRDLDVFLVERDARKAAFLSEVIRTTGIRAQLRRENAEVVQVPSADVVTARAFAPLPRLCGVIHRILRPDGLALLLKGEKVQGELTAARKEWKMRANCVASESDPTGTILVIGGLSPVNSFKRRPCG